MNNTLAGAQFVANGDTVTAESEAPSENSQTTAVKAKAERRKIPGNLPYTTSAGVLRRVIDKIPETEKPAVFSLDFLGTVMQATGGSARQVPPVLKATGLLNQASVPTELYGQFQTEAGRPAAALQALRNGFPEIFRRNQYAHRADENGLLDAIVSVTGLPRTDNIVRYILTTFQTLQSFAKTAAEGRVTDLPPPGGPS